jgi:hypothetical protein
MFDKRAYNELDKIFERKVQEWMRHESKNLNFDVQKKNFNAMRRDYAVKEKVSNFI